MKKILSNSLFTMIVIPITVSIFIALIDIEAINKTLVTFSDLFTIAFKFMAPFLVMVFLAYNLRKIEAVGGFFVKYILVLLSSLVAVAFFALFMSIVFVEPFVNTWVEMSDGYAPVDGWFTIPSLPFSFPMWLAFIIGLVFGLGFKGQNKINQIVDFTYDNIIAVFLKWFMILIPLFMIATFSLLILENKFQQFFLVDAYLSAIVLLTQGGWLLLMALLSKIISNGRYKFKSIVNALWKNFAIGITFIPSETAAPYYIKNMVDADVHEEVASTTFFLSTQISRPGSIISNIIFAYSIMNMAGVEQLWYVFIPYMMLLIFASMIGSGMPGGVFAVTSSLLTPMLGFTESMLSAMQIMYWKQGASNSGTNVASHVYVAAIVDNKMSLGKKKPEKKSSINL